MFVTNSLNRQTLFSAPLGYPDTPTLLKRPTSTYTDEYLTPLENYPSTNVVVNAATTQLRTFINATASTIADGQNRNSTVKSYLRHALSALEQLESLAQTAAENTTSDLDRLQLNTMANDIIQKLDSIYLNASYNGDFVMRGGSFSLGAGVDGQELTISYGNVDRSELGISTVDLTSIESAETAGEALEDAVSKVEAQYSIAQADSTSLETYRQAGMAEIYSTQSQLSVDVSNEYVNVAFENSKAAISSRMVFAVNVQGADIRVSSVAAMVNELETMSGEIRKAREKAEEEKAKGVKKTGLEEEEKFQNEEESESKIPVSQESIVQVVSADQPDVSGKNNPAVAQAVNLFDVQVSTDQGQTAPAAANNITGATGAAAISTGAASAE